MPFQYSSAPQSPELRQGEILSEFWEYRPENPVSNRKQDTPIPVMPIYHKYVIVMTQDCDLASDYRKRIEGDHEHRNILRSLLLCELFEEGMKRKVNKKIPSTRGGKREGAGRPSIGGRRVQLTLDDKTIDKGTNIGEGNLSLGVRIAVKDYNKKR